MANKEEKPLTREDVLKMIEEHGGTEGLDLSERNLEGIHLSFGLGEAGIDLHGINLRGANLQEADLSDAKLQKADLRYARLQEANLTLANLQEAKLSFANLQGANLPFANLQEADLSFANLQNATLWDANLQEARLWDANLQEAGLSNANLQEANLSFANLQGADLRGAKVSGTRLYGAKISHETRLEDVEWGPKYILGDEEDGDFKVAAAIYRILKQWHTQAGVYDIAGKFYFREMTVRRKAMKWRPNPLPRAWYKLLAVLCGYGERPLNVVISALVVVFGVSLGIYLASALTFLSSLYHSAVSFTALGYGLGVSNVDGWVKAVGAAEAFMGVFMMALFLITFVRKMTR